MLSRLTTQTRADDPTLIYFSSGTTSGPKLVEHTRKSAATIFAHVDRNLAPYQRIRRIEFMERPKTISGKIRRVELRTRENTCEPNDLTYEYRDR
jgi:acyl-coenzyme A synthetase/AMP-(fatty) acid ligase